MPLDPERLARVFAAADRFEEAVKADKDARFRATLAKALERQVAAMFKAQGKAFVKALAALREADDPRAQDPAGLLALWLATWDRVAKAMRKKVTKPYLAPINQAFGRGEMVIVDQVRLAVNAIRARGVVPPKPVTPDPPPPLLKPGAAPKPAPPPPAPAPQPLPSPDLPAAPSRVTGSIVGEFRARDPRAAAYINEHAAQLVAGIDDTTKQRLATLLKNGFARGDSITKLTNAIVDQFTEFGQERAKLIATTEINQAFQAGQMAAALEMTARGVPMEKHWRSKRDGDVEFECATNDEEGWIPMDQDFSSGHACPLCHPRCRCHLMTRVAATFLAEVKVRWAHGRQETASILAG